jgi:predicted aspartyl protease
MRTMGRIVASVWVGNQNDPSKKIRCDALVDTGASHVVLPTAWRDRLGDLEELTTLDFETAIGTPIRGVVCGPVRVQIEGFRPTFTEVAFVEMEPQDGEYEPLIGYLALEQCGIAVDMLGHRLVPVKRLDLK